ncbi:hydantoinase/oxoprolinase family protein, partial [Acinetobacter baumannii]|uniref:hydantoinase/oxoprolinase family protein n=1 Tax=Acinetobacter baumannii TaxID=470 RepID=UPI002890A78E
CLVADALGMKTVFIHSLAGVLSAYGMGLADQTAMREQAVEEKLSDDALDSLATRLSALAEAARGQLSKQGVESQRIALVER